METYQENKPQFPDEQTVVDDQINAIVNSESFENPDVNPDENSPEASENPSIAADPLFGQLHLMDARLAHLMIDVNAGANIEDAIKRQFAPLFADSDDISDRLAKAEQKGFIRGRNEAIADELSRPAPFANPAHESITSADDTFLAGYRDPIWD